MKIFVFAAVAVAFLQVVSGNVASSDCSTFDPIHACDHCDFSRSYVQYVANPCNCTEYFSCEKTRGYITAHKQACARCLCFSDKTWGCTIYNNDAEDCPVEPPITEIRDGDEECCYRYGNGPSGIYLQQYRHATGEDFEKFYLWMVNEYPVKMPCPPGTFFNITACECVHCVPNHECAGQNVVQFCLDWEDWFSGNKRTYYNPAASCNVNPSTAGPFNHVLSLNGIDCDVEVPYFQKNQFSEFTFCGAFYATSNGPAGLAFDGGRPSDDCNPSIYINIDQHNYVWGGIYTENSNVFNVQHPTPIVLNQWYTVCLRYDGSYLDLYLGFRGHLGSSQRRPAWGFTELNRCNMLLGASVKQSNPAEYDYFEGEMDDWCFSRSYLSPVPDTMLGGPIYDPQYIYKK